MRRDQLKLLLTEARRLTLADEVLVIGSQSVLATWDETVLPEEATRSREADMLVRVRAGTRLSPEQSDLISQLLEHSGILSEFDDRHGIHIGSISPDTATLPNGWEDRLVPLTAIGHDHQPVIGVCLDPYDACASKLVANRDHDRAFVHAMVTAGLIDASRLQSRLELYPPNGPDINHAFVSVQSYLD